MKLIPFDMDCCPGVVRHFFPRRIEVGVERRLDVEPRVGGCVANQVDDHLMTDWRLLAGGKPVIETSRYIMIRDTINHWVHHRGQMTVYLRLMGARVPALYGPSADDKNF